MGKRIYKNSKIPVTKNIGGAGVCRKSPFYRFLHLLSLYYIRTYEFEKQPNWGFPTNSRDAEI